MALFRQVLMLVPMIFFTGLTWSSLALSAQLDVQVQALLEANDPAKTIPVIVTFRNPLKANQLQIEPGPLKRRMLVQTLKTHARDMQADVRQFLQSRTSVPIKDLWIINGLATEATPATISELAQRPEILSIEYDRVISLPEPEITQVTSPPEPNIELINAPVLWDLGFAGQNVVVAVMDSGVDLNHADLAPRWRGSDNSWYDPNGEHPAQPYDNDGHGTGVLGVILGGDTSGTTLGVAPEAQWIAVKIFDDSGDARLSNIHLGFAWLLDPDGNPATDDAPHIVNNSWDFGDSINQCISEVQEDINLLKEAGIAVVFAGGNSGPDPSTSSPPGNNPAGFAVGSVGTESSSTTVSPFSSRGPSACDGTVYPEIVAPGFFIRTADLTLDGSVPHAYAYVSGTSIAAPHVSGAMALLLSAFPGLTPEALETALKSSAIDLGISGADNSYGYGLIDADTAFDLLNNALLSINDPVAPANDGQLAFGHIPVGTRNLRTLELQNNGQGILAIEDITITGSGAFSIAGNNCPGILTSAADCQISIAFAPTVHREENAILQVASNGSATGFSSVTLSGFGNTGPVAADLVAPANGATGLETPITLQWDQRSDADGDSLTYRIRYSTSSDFDEVPPIEITANTGTGILLFAGSGSFLLLIPAMWRRKRCWQKAGLTVVLVTLFLFLSSCGGGGGSDNSSSENSETTMQSSFILENLLGGTTYYWQVVSTDSLGAEAESPVWSFTTSP